eukprot:scaffold147198_cov16-Prasinocladus_malaysianus.AAC.1
MLMRPRAQFRHEEAGMCVADLCGVSADTQEDAQALLPAVFGRGPHGRVPVAVGRAGIHPGRQQNLQEVDQVDEPACGSLRYTSRDI